MNIQLGSTTAIDILATSKALGLHKSGLAASTHTSEKPADMSRLSKCLEAECCIVGTALLSRCYHRSNDIHGDGRTVKAIENMVACLANIHTST